MTEPERPKLSLGEPPGALRNRMSPVSKAWLWLFLLLQLVTVACLAALSLRPAQKTAGAGASPPAADADELRRVARGLENRGLEVQAARAWGQYLAAAPDTPERAEILYRIGGLYFDAQRFDEAAAALVQSELAAAENKELKSKIGRKLVEALRRSGRYGEVDRELSRQVEVGGAEPGRGKVLATLAGETLTEADLDRIIERRVDQMLAVEGASADQAARQAILRQFSSPQARREMLQDILQTKLFCRRARELKLDQREEFLQARDQLAERFLAGRFLARELEKIQPTQVDLESYYRANQERYEQQESLRAVVIQLGDEEDATAVLEKIESADDFVRLARERAGSDDAGSEAAWARTIVRGRTDPVLGPPEELFEISEGQWTTTPLVHQGRRYLVLVQDKTRGGTPPLSEILPQVRADYVARKQKELSEKLLSDLMTRYNVRIMPPDESGGGPAEPEKQQDKGKKKP